MLEKLHLKLNGPATLITFIDKEQYFLYDTISLTKSGIELEGHNVESKAGFFFSVKKNAVVRLDMHFLNYLVLYMASLWNHKLVIKYMKKYLDKYDDNRCYNTTFRVINEGEFTAFICTERYKNFNDGILHTCLEGLLDGWHKRGYPKSTLTLQTQNFKLKTFLKMKLVA